jgi:hypothetical protein
MRQAMVAHIYNPSYSGGKSRIKACYGKKLETPFQPIKAGCGGVHLSSQLSGNYK